MIWDEGGNLSAYLINIVKSKKIILLIVFKY